MKTCDEDLSRVAKEFFNGMKSLEENVNWTLKQERPLQIHSLEIAGRTVVKAVTIFNTDFEQTLSFFSEPEFLKFTCDEAENTEVIYKTDGLSVIHMHTKAMFPFSSREVVAINTCKVEGKKAYCGNRSCNYPCKTDPNAIRMELYIAGFILESV